MIAEAEQIEFQTLALHHLHVGHIRDAYLRKVGLTGNRAQRRKLRAVEFYYMPGYTGAALRYVTFVLPGAVLTIPAALLAFWLVQRIHDGFRIDNGVV